MNTVIKHTSRTSSGVTGTGHYTLTLTLYVTNLAHETIDMKDSQTVAVHETNCK